MHRTVTLASLVEKEAKLEPDERPLIAAVFENRLRIGMKLDCDPTTIYAALLEDRYRGTIYRSDLESDNPYNTYQHAGLPPGPIANPGAGFHSGRAASGGFQAPLFRAPAGWIGRAPVFRKPGPAVRRHRQLPPWPTADKSVKRRLREYLAAERPPAITEAVWRDLLRAPGAGFGKLSARPAAGHRPAIRAALRRHPPAHLRRAGTVAGRDAGGVRGSRWTPATASAPGMRAAR